MTLMCIDRSQSPTHKGNFLQGGKQTVSNNINQQQNANHRKNNSSSPPLSSKTHNNCNNEKSSPESTRRSSSESSSDRRAVQSNSSRYKTELCRPFEENGICKYGDKCQFAHGIKELRSMARHPKYKTELCRTFHSTGLCPYGPRCHFIHNSEQTKKILLNNLTGNPPSSRPKALISIGSAGDVSPTSSHSGSPTGSKSFDDLFQQQLSPGNVFFSHENFVTNYQLSYDYNGADYDSINVRNDKSSAEMVDNRSYHLYSPGSASPTSPFDSSMRLSPYLPGYYDAACFQNVK